MTVLPVIQCELRVALRRQRARRMQLGCAVGGAVLAIWMLVTWSGVQTAATLSAQFVRVLGTAGFVGALVSGLMLTADTISREKREGTLNLLFLSDVTARDLVLGKLLAKGILPFYGLLALFPMLMVAVLMGRSSVGEFARIFLAWCNGLIVALALSMVTSTYCWQQRSANLRAAFVLLGMTIGLPWLGFILSSATKHSGWALLASAFSPDGPFEAAMTRPASPGRFWASLICNQVLAFACLGLATQRVLRFQLEGVERPIASSARRWIKGADHEKSASSADLLERHPLEWLEGRRSGGWAWSDAVAGLIACSLLFLPVDPFGNAVGLNSFVVLMACNVGLKLRLAGYAAYAFAVDRQIGTLESLLGTRVDVVEITHSMFRALVRRFRGPVGVLILLTLGLTVGALRRGASPASVLILACSGLLLLWDCYAIIWVAFYEGLVARTAALGVATAATQIVVLPWVWFGIAAQIFWKSSRIEFLILWGMIVVLNHLVFLARVRGSFRRRFRVLALKPAGEKNPPIWNDWSPINWEEETTTGGVAHHSSAAPEVR